MDSININILHVVRSFDVSGRSRLIRAICRGCVMDGVTSAVVSLSNNCGYKQSDVDVVSLGIGGGFKLSAIFKLVKMIRYRKVNVVHSHGRGSLIYAALACMFLPGVRLIHTVHRADGDLVSRHDVLRGLVLGRADHLVAVSRSAASEFAAVNKCSVDEIKVIYNGIDLSEFDGFRAKDVIDDGKPVVIGTVANLSSDKDFDTLLRAFAVVLDIAVETGRTLSLRIIGDGPCAEVLHKLAKNIGIYNDVNFMGFRKDVPAQLAEFDVFVLSTKTEGFGIAILEAMASGVPVVAIRVGGVLEIIEDEKNGLLFEVGNVQELVDAMTKVIADDALKAKFIHNASETVTSKFSQASMIAAYKEIYAR